MTIELKPGGLLIAIEGIDGAGKTTLARRLTTTLEAAGARVVLSKEPTNGPWGTKLRQSAATGRLSADEEAELLIRDRHEHVDTLIAPALARGDIVILDRYFPSMVAYQALPACRWTSYWNSTPSRRARTYCCCSTCPRPPAWPVSARAAMRPITSKPKTTWNAAAPSLPGWNCRANTCGCQRRRRQRAAPGARHHRGRISRPTERRRRAGRHRQGRAGTALGRPPGLSAVLRVASRRVARQK